MSPAAFTPCGFFSSFKIVAILPVVTTVVLPPVTLMSSDEEMPLLPSPVAVTLTVPPAMMMRASLFIPFTSMPEVLTASEPPSMTMRPLSVSVLLVFAPTSRPSPEAVMLTVPPCMRKNSLTWKPSATALATVIEPRPLCNSTYSSAKKPWRTLPFKVRLPEPDHSEWPLMTSGALCESVVSSSVPLIPSLSMFAVPSASIIVMSLPHWIFTAALSGHESDSPLRMNEAFFSPSI